MALRDHLAHLGISVDIHDDDLFPANDSGLDTLRRIAGTVGVTIILVALIGLALSEF